MNKYQKYLLDKTGGIKYLITALFVGQDECCKNNYISFNEEDDSFTLTQDEDINEIFIFSILQLKSVINL